MIDFDDDTKFKDIYYTTLKQCNDNEKESYNTSKITFKVKFPNIKPLTLKSEKEDKSLLKHDVTCKVKKNETLTKGLNLIIMKTILFQK